MSQKGNETHTHERFIKCGLTRKPLQSLFSNISYAYKLISSSFMVLTKRVNFLLDFVTTSDVFLQHFFVSMLIIFQDFSKKIGVTV